jgi:outer membrane protein assembly factor BamB
MTTDQSARKPFRVWPGIAAVVVQWLFWFVTPIVRPEAAIIGFLAALVCGLIVLVWWLFFSRAPWVERIGGLVLIVIGVALSKRIVHPSIAGGMMGMMLYIFSIPLMSLVLVAWAVATRPLSTGLRRAALVVAVVLGCAAFTLVRTGGMSGEGKSDLHWRWTSTPEEKLLAQGADEPTAAPVAGQPVSAESGWPGFRGAKRDGIAHAAKIKTDWTASPPVQLWRRPIGPGWSSFAVRDNLIYTQEQRGDNEVVACYNLTNGKPVWKHNDAARFYESNGGAGPRGTPTLNGDRVYTFGATGIVNALDARNGGVIWSRNAAADTQTKTPGWGFSSSPLVVGDVVIVAASGALAAYDINNGNPRWYGPTGGHGYSSPQLATIGGVQQILLLNGQGVISVSPADGSLLWKYAWEGDSIVQPAMTPDGDVLVGSGSGLGSEVGLLRVAVARDANTWTPKERWVSIGLKPYYNDFVVNKDYAFGFDGSSLACIDLKNGERKWKGGNYGHGQILLLPDQYLILVLSEEGELGLVKAAPDQFTEITKFKAIDGKTWNHPVVVGDVVLVRNGEEMAAFRLPRDGG